MILNEKNTKFIKIGRGIESEKVAVIGELTPEMYLLFNNAFEKLSEKIEEFSLMTKKAMENTYIKYNTTPDKLNKFKENKWNYEISADKLAIYNAIS